MRLVSSKLYFWPLSIAFFNFGPYLRFCNIFGLFPSKNDYFWTQSIAYFGNFGPKSMVINTWNRNQNHKKKPQLRTKIARERLWEQTAKISYNRGPKCNLFLQLLLYLYKSSNGSNSP